MDIQSLRMSLRTTFSTAARVVSTSVVSSLARTAIEMLLENRPVATTQRCGISVTNIRR